MKNVLSWSIMFLSVMTHASLSAIEKKVAVENGIVTLKNQSIPIYGPVKEVDAALTDSATDGIVIDYYFPEKATVAVMKKVASFYQGKTIFGVKVGKLKPNPANKGAYAFQSCNDGKELLIVVEEYNGGSHVTILDKCMP